MTLPKNADPKIDLTAPTFLHNGGATGDLLRQMDWSHHPFGPPDRWPAALKTVVNVVLGARQPMFVCWGPDHHTIYNDGFAEICGPRHPGSLGARLLDTWHDIADVVAPLLGDVYKGESVYIDDLAVTLVNDGIGGEAFFAFSYTPVQDETGIVMGCFCACTDITREVQFKLELAHERARLEQMFQESHSFIAMLDGPDHTFAMINPAYKKLVGYRDVMGKAASVVLPEVNLQPYMAMLDKVRASGDAIRVDSAKVALQRIEGGEVEDRYVDFIFQPMRDLTGAVTKIFVEGVDVTDRVNALSALQTSEQFLRSVLGASSDCIKVLDLEGRLTYITDGGKLVMEIPDGQDVIGRVWPSFWQGDGRKEAQHAVALAKSGTRAAFQGYGDTFAGNPKYWDVRVTPMLDDAGHPERILAVSRDISYLKQIEDEREQLMQELSHRLRNAFGMVQSVIGQTLRNAASLAEGRETLAGRVKALADAQDLLTRSVAGEMQITAVVEAALLPYRTGAGRFAISGPAAIITGRQGLGLSLALHELCTNATKYGALSGDIGTVELNWDIQADGAFKFRWQEREGPPVVTPQKSGFGSVLIEKIVASYFTGSATLDFHSVGVVFQLSGKITPTGALPGHAPQ